ncbi:hypothetical protein ACFVX6_26935 [Streptomyces sp. NPDC058289]|uniref:hypothetical protein n=1 Tax=Streptomyces sp. NPDC058289 TaxID=3346425 RepID=UPI0036E8FBD1
MTTLNLTGYPAETGYWIEVSQPRLDLPQDLMTFFGRMGKWLESPPGRVVTQQLWPALGGGVTDAGWTPPSPTVSINLASLTRPEKATLARHLDEFARSYPNTGMIRALVASIVAEDEAARTDPHAPSLLG